MTASGSVRDDHSVALLIQRRRRRDVDSSLRRLTAAEPVGGRPPFRSPDPQTELANEVEGTLSRRQIRE
jgi:hypothetical protein